MSTLVMVSLAACNNDENENLTNGSQNTPTFTASIDGLVNTRATDQTWGNGDAIGITGKSGETQYTNVQYTTTAGDGNFTVAKESESIYYQDGSEVYFTAYYPWNGTSTTITASTEEQSKQNTFDFLYGTGTGSKSSPDVELSFKHKMAKVAFTIEKGKGVSFDEVKAAKLSLRGFFHQGTFDGLTGTATATEGEVTDWCFAGNIATPAYNAPYTTDDTNETVTYTLICFPQAFAATLPFAATLDGKQTFKAELDFTTANTAAGDENTGNYWTGGRQYNMGIRLNKAGVTVTGCNIEPWTEADGGIVDADAEQ